MKVQELMTKDVLTIGPEAPLKDVAALLVERGISGLPVCDAERRVLGIVSEGDVLYKEHDPARRGKGGPLAWLVDGGSSAALAKARARTVRDAMTSPAITVAPWTSVAEAARLMTERGVNRLPVVRNDELVGIVTRADLVRAFARGDAEIEREIVDDLLGRTLWAEEGTVDVEVSRGSVTLTGVLPSRSEAELLERLAARVPGVVSVESRVTWQVDDSGAKARRSAERTLR